MIVSTWMRGLFLYGAFCRMRSSADASVIDLPVSSSLRKYGTWRIWDDLGLFGHPGSVVSNNLIWFPTYCHDDVTKSSRLPRDWFFKDIWWLTDDSLMTHYYMIYYMILYEFIWYYSTVIWYSLIFIDIHWYSLIFIDIHWYSLIFIDIHWYSLIFLIWQMFKGFHVLRMFRLAELLCRELQAENSRWAPWHLGLPNRYSIVLCSTHPQIVRQCTTWGSGKALWLVRSCKAKWKVWFSTWVEARHCSIPYLTRSIGRAWQSHVAQVCISATKLWQLARVGGSRAVNCAAGAFPLLWGLPSAQRK